MNEYFQRNISGSIARPWPAVTLLRSVTVAAAGLGLAAGVGYGLRAAIFQARERPAAMEQARVLTAMSGLSKSVAFSDESIGRITDIRSLRRHGQGSGTLRIVGTKAAVTLDDGHEVLDIVRFAGCCTRVNGIDEALAEQGFFYDRGGWCCDPSVIDAQGQVLWTYSAAVGANDMDASDMDGDGRLDFVIGFNGDGGVHLLDADGHVAWQAPDGNVWHVEFADIDGDGRQEIVHSNADGLIVVRAQDGEVLSVAEPEAYVSDFSLVRWPSSHALESVLYAKDDAVHLLGFRGEVRAALPAPLSEILGEARAAVFHAADQDLLAVVVEYPSWDRSMIYLYDASHGLLYHEVVADRLGAVAAAPGEGGNEDLLVGGNGHMLRYRWTAVSTIAHSEIGGATQPR